MIFQQTFTIDSNGVKADNVTNIIPCSISSDSDYNNYQPTPASGEEADSILQKIQERSSWIGSGSTENSEGDDTYEDSEGTDSEDSSKDYSGDEDLTDREVGFPGYYLPSSIIHSGNRQSVDVRFSGHS